MRVVSGKKRHGQGVSKPPGALGNEQFGGMSGFDHVKHARQDEQNQFKCTKHSKKRLDTCGVFLAQVGSYCDLKGF